VAERRWYQAYLPASFKLPHGKRTPVAAWLSELGCFGLRSHEKRVPDKVFQQTMAGIGEFLKHLWATDGCVFAPPDGKAPRIYYASSSRQLASDVQSLLLQLQINASVRRIPQRAGRDQFHVDVNGAEDWLRFAMLVGSVRPGADDHLARLVAGLGHGKSRAAHEMLPRSVWAELVLPTMKRRGMTHRAFSLAMGTRDYGAATFQSSLGRERAQRVATVVRSEVLMRLATSDVTWDEIACVTPDAVEDVYDLTVDGLHNFVAENVYLHNSIEQDADVVLFLYRPGMHKEDIDRSVTELLVEKNRNGPTGKIDLVFIANQTSFREPAMRD
jgi:replicative DNA helicase